MRSLKKAHPAHVCVAAKRATQYATENGCTLRAFAGLSRCWVHWTIQVTRPRVPIPFGICRLYRVRLLLRNARALFAWFLLAPNPFRFARLLTVSKLLNRATDNH